ncbi:MAG: hypothetical protein IPQ24_16130 [Anaeromyxobacter sp.]|nr:hypothetical protein [Anaeromyxobacter sp.]
MRPIDDVVTTSTPCLGSLYINGDENIWWLGKTQRHRPLHRPQGQQEALDELRPSPPSSPDGACTLQGRPPVRYATVRVGWESITDHGLEEYRADRKVGIDCERAVKTLKDAGIDVSSSSCSACAPTPSTTTAAPSTSPTASASPCTPPSPSPIPAPPLRDQYHSYLFKDLGLEYSHRRSTPSTSTLTPA